MALLLRSAWGAASPLLAAARGISSGLGKLPLGAAGSSNSQQSAQANGQGPSQLLHTLREQRAADAMDQLRFNTAAIMAGRKEEEDRPHAPAAAGMLLRTSSAMPMLPPRVGSNLHRRGPMQLQRRAYHAWSPVQRYFVEGDHVIQAELNRTLQFTGLDAGSFYPLAVYTVIATAISAVFMVVPLLIAPSRVDLDKSSAYECGFDAFGEARQTFSVSFYLVSIMYLLFDIEIAYLFPYVMSHADSQMFWTMNTFLGLLVVGFCYEWGVGALEWRE